MASNRTAKQDKAISHYMKENPSLVPQLSVPLSGLITFKNKVDGTYTDVGLSYMETLYVNDKKEEAKEAARKKKGMTNNGGRPATIRPVGSEPQDTIA